MQFPWPRLIRIPAFIVGVVWAIFPSLASSQKSAKEILALPEPERFNALWDWGALEPLGDTTSIENHLRQLEEDFRKLKEPYYMKQAWLMQAVYKPIRVHYYREYGIQLMNTYIEDARDRGWQDMEAECILRKGLMCYAQGRFEAAFEFIQKGYELLKKTGLTNSPFILHHLEHIGNSYYEFGDMPGAIYFLQEAIGLPNKADEPGSRRRIFNTLALCYQQMEQYDSAIHYYTLSYEGSVAAKDTFWAALANGNKGYVYYLHGQYDEAIPLMETDFEQSIRYKVWPSAANAAMGLATMFLTKGNLEKTQYYLDFAGKNINYWNLRDVSGYYKNLAAISRLKGNYDDAFTHRPGYMVIYTPATT